jgi:hypothetical protein
MSAAHAVSYRAIAVSSVLLAFSLTIATLTALFARALGRAWATVGLTLSISLLFILFLTTAMAFLPDPDDNLWTIEFSETIGFFNPAAAMMSATGQQTQFLGLLVPAPLGDFFSARKIPEKALPLWQIHLIVVSLFVGLPIAAHSWLRRHRL